MVFRIGKLYILGLVGLRRRFLAQILAISLFVTFGWFRPCSAQQQPAQDTVNEIAKALRDRNFTQALHLCEAALSRNPGDYRIWTLRGMAKVGTGDLPKALIAYQSALKLSPNYLPALEGAAQTEFQLGDAGAAPLLLKILAQRPDDETAHAFLGVIEYKKNDCTDAVVQFEKATTTIARQPGVLNDYGICLAGLNRNDQAVGIFSEALELDSANPGARYNLALAQWNAHLADDALKTLEFLIDATPPYGDALTLAADILESNGDTVHAIELLRKALTANPKDIPVYLRFAMLSFDHASPQVGIDMINFGLAQVQNEPKLYLARGILLTQLGEFTRAADDFETASRIDPNVQFLDVAQGLVRSQQHNSTEALEKFRAAVRAHPNEAYAHYLLAEALLEEDKQPGSKDSDEELKAALRATELDPQLVAAQDLLATIFLENGNTAGAIKHSRAALARDPNDQQAIYHLIVALRKTDAKDQIPPLLKQLIELRTNNQSGKTVNRYRLSDAATSPDSTSP
ncbi:MAG: tetratricopeptide repeat protein [Terracidiphilus sp.]